MSKVVAPLGASQVVDWSFSQSPQVEEYSAASYVAFSTAWRNKDRDKAYLS